MPEARQPDLIGQTVWDRIAESHSFKQLMAAKRTFVVPAFVFFLTYYLSLLVLVGYAPNFMSIKIWGNVNLAYVFALSQFFMAWIIAALFVRASEKFDKLSKDIIEEALKSPGPESEK